MRNPPVLSLPREASRASGYTPSAPLAGALPRTPFPLTARWRVKAGAAVWSPRSPRVRFLRPRQVDQRQRRKTRCRPPYGPVWRSGISAPTLPANIAKRRNERDFLRSIFKQDKGSVRLAPARASLHRPATPFGDYGFCHNRAGFAKKLSEADRKSSVSRALACQQKKLALG
jgi:hypothetical protein